MSLSDRRPPGVRPSAWIGFGAMGCWIWLMLSGCGAKSTPRPTPAAEPFTSHVGSHACTECHPGETESFRQSPMGRSLHLVTADSHIAKGSFEQTWPSAGLSARYQIARAGHEYVMTEHLQLPGGGQSSQTHPLAVAV